VAAAAAAAFFLRSAQETVWQKKEAQPATSHCCLAPACHQAGRKRLIRFGIRFGIHVVVRYATTGQWSARECGNDPESGHSAYPTSAPLVYYNT
jgi:hypothetical protein